VANQVVSKLTLSSDPLRAKPDDDKVLCDDSAVT